MQNQSARKRILERSMVWAGVRNIAIVIGVAFLFIFASYLLFEAIDRQARGVSTGFLSE